MIYLKEEVYIMTTNDIGKIIKKFIESNESAIIIDGNWGIGKTCSIDDFLKHEKDKEAAFDDCKFHYISLFGFKDIDTLHKELYKRFHPFLVFTAKALSYISLAEPIRKWMFLFNTDKAKEDICKKQEKGFLHKKYKCNVIIFDDLERVAAQKDGFIELMGYFNRLIKEGIKIICICNSNEIEAEKRGVFDNFKEKIFDRTYTINEENIEVIKKIFNETYDLLDSESISFFEKNLRLVNKTKIFIDDVFEQLSANKSKEKFEKRVVCLICILIVKEVFGSDLSREFKEELQKKVQSEDSAGKSYAESMLKEKDDDIISVRSIVWILKKQQIYSKYDLVSGLYNYFKYCDDSFFSYTEANDNLLGKSIFFYSDEEKKDKLNYILTEIDERFDNYSADQIYGAVNDICQYGGGLLVDDDYNKLVHSIIESKDEEKKKTLLNKFDITLHMEPCANQKKFVEVLDRINQEKELEEFVDYFENLDKNNYDETLFDWTKKIRNNKKHLTKEMCDYLEENDFFIPDLSKTISENAWGFCHAICGFIMDIDKSYKEPLIAVLDNQVKANPDSVCLKERVDALKKYKLLC